MRSAAFSWYSSFRRLGSTTSYTDAIIREVAKLQECAA